MSNLTEKLLDLQSNGKDPQSYLFEYGSENEPDIKPEKSQIHRSVAALFVEGNSPGQIAEKLGIAAEKVKTLLKQEHTQEVIKDLVSAQGQEGVASILAATEVDSVLKLIEVRDDPGTPKNVVVQTISKLFELQRGKKPYSSGEEDETPTGNALANKVGDLDKQISELQKRK